MDERLAAARDSVLALGETVVAQQMGDQGQAIVLTSSRILIVKAGLTATGTLNGQRVSSFELKELETVKLRRGPMGAVIQLCGQGRFLTTPGQSPDSVIVFGDEKKIRKCEAMAAEIEAVLGRPVERIEAAPESETPAQASEQQADTPPAEEAVPQLQQKPEKKSLADEIFEKMTAAPEEHAAAAETEHSESMEEPEPAEVAAPVIAEEQVVEEEDALEPEIPASEQPVKNPYLPRPSRPRGRGPSKAILVLGGLAALAVVCICVTAPLRQPPKYDAPKVEASALQLSRTAVSRQVAAIDTYRTNVSAILASSKAETTAFKEALGKADRSALVQSVGRNTPELAWQRLRDLEPPPGLVGAKQRLVGGAFALKSTIADASASAQTGATIDYQRVATETAGAEETIRNALASIDATRASLADRGKKT